MATTSYGVGHPLAVRQWARKLFEDALKKTYISKFVGKSTNSLIQRRDETSKDAGDRVTVGLRMQLSNSGVSGDTTLEGNEEALVTYTDDLYIDQIRHAVRSAGQMSEQRVPFSVRDEAREALSDWLADTMDYSFFNQITGNTNESDTNKTGMQATIAPSTNRWLIKADTSDETSLSTSHPFQLTFIDEALIIAKTASPTMRPLKMGGNDYYCMFLHPRQVYDLRTDATAARVTWYDTQKARVQGGEMDNGIFSGALGTYNGVVLHESTRIPTALTNTGGYRSVLCGAQAACVGYGKGYGNTQMKWVEELFDYENQLGVATGLIWGLKKLQFNSEDFSTIVVSTGISTAAGG